MRSRKFQTGPDAVQTGPDAVQTGPDAVKTGPGRPEPVQVWSRSVLNGRDHTFNVSF